MITGNSAALPAHWNQLIQDQQLSPDELKATKNQLQASAPELSETEIEAQLATLLVNSTEGLDAESAQALIARVFQGETLNLQTLPSSKHAPALVSFDKPSDSPILLTDQQLQQVLMSETGAGATQLYNAGALNTPGLDPYLTDYAKETALRYTANQVKNLMQNPRDLEPQALREQLSTLYHSQAFQDLPQAEREAIASLADQQLRMPLERFIQARTELAAPDGDRASREVSVMVAGAEITDSNGVRTGASNDISGQIDSLQIQAEADERDLQGLLEGVKGPLRDHLTELIDARAGILISAEGAREIAQHLVAHLQIQAYTQDGEVRYDFNLDQAFHDNLSSYHSGLLSLATQWPISLDLSSPMMTLSSRDGQLTLDAPNNSMAEFLRDAEQVQPDFGPAPAATELPPDAAPADQAEVQALLARIDWPGNDPRRQTQLISGDRDQRTLLNLFNQGALAGLPPELRERAEYWATETAALDAEQALRNWHGQDASQNQALQQLLLSPAFSALPTERRTALMQSAQGMAEALAGSHTPLREDQRSLLATLTPHLQPWQQAGERTQAEGLIAQGLQQLRAQGIDLSVRVESDGKRSYQLMPEHMTLEGEALQRMLTAHPQLAELGDLSNGRLTLRPEHFAVSFGPQGIGVELNHIALSGGTDTTASEVSTSESASDPTRLQIDTASGSVQLNQQGELTHLSLSELSGRLEGDITLDHEVVTLIQERVTQALQELDSYLSRYGLGHEQLMELLNQLPTDALQQLSTSASQSDLNNLAQRFGLSGDQLSNLAAFLRDAPAQQLVNELHTLTERLGQDTYLTGGVAFNLSDLSLSREAGNLLASLGQLNLSLSARAASPDGTQTDLTAEVNVNTLNVTQTDAGTAADAGPIQAQISAESVSEAPPVPPSAAEQFAAFQAELTQGGGQYRVTSGDRAGYLRDAHTTQGGLRNGNGLTVARALEQLSQASPEAWAEMLDADRATRDAFYREHGIDQHYNDYLLKYFAQYVMPHGHTAADRQAIEIRGEIQSAEFDPAGLSFGGISGRASVEAETQGTQTDVEVSGAMAQIELRADRSVASDLHAAGQGTLRDADGNLTTGSGQVSIGAISAHPEREALPAAEEVAAFIHQLTEGGGSYRVESGDRTGYLRDNHSSQGGLRNGNGLTVASALEQLGKASPTDWARMLSADRETRDAFYREHGIDQPYNDYLLNYLQSYVVGQSGQTAGITATDLEAAGQAHIQGPIGEGKVSGSAHLDTLHADESGVQGQGIQGEVRIETDRTTVSIAAQSDQAEAHENGLTSNVAVDWSFHHQGQGARVTLEGSSTLNIEDSQLTGTLTGAHDAQGNARMDSRAFLAFIESNHPGMAGFFRERGVFGQSHPVNLQLTNTEDIRTGANGQVEEYQVRASVSGVSTPYGPVSASLYADDNGSITGDILLHQPNQQLADLVKEQLTHALRSSLASMNPRDRQATQQLIDSLQVQYSHGRFEVSFEGQRFVRFDVGLSIVPDGDRIHVSVDRMALQNTFLNQVKNALGLNNRAMGAVRNALLDQLPDNIPGTAQGHFGLSIRTQNLVEQFLGPDSGNIRIEPRITTQGELNLQYWID